MSALSEKLDRYLIAQESMYPTALREVRAGMKFSNWVWPVFPGLGCFERSWDSVYYGLSSLQEAAAYYDHAVLGARLREIAGAMLENRGVTAASLFGPDDARRVHGCLTLFHCVAPGDSSLRGALVGYYDGRPEGRTIARLGLAGAWDI